MLRWINNHSQRWRQAKKMNAGHCLFHWRVAGKTESSETSKGRLTLGTARKDPLRCGDGISEHDFGQAILIFGIGVGDVSFGFLEFGLAEFDDGAETLSSAHSHSWLRAFTQGLNRNTNFRSEVSRFPRSEPKIPMLVGTIQEGGDGDRSQGCTGPRGRTVREDQARSVSQAGVTCE